MRTLDLSVYTPVGDAITIVTCIIYWFLLKSTYTVRKENIKLFHAANGICAIAASASIYYHYLLADVTRARVVPIYILGDIFHISLIALFIIFNTYLRNLINLSKKEARIMHVVMSVVFVLFACAQITLPFTHIGMYIDSNLQVHDNFYTNIFIFAYVFYAVISTYIIVAYRKRFITKVRNCLQSVMILAFICMLSQAFVAQTSFTCITFTFPIVASLFLFHYNAYDAITGTLDEKSFSSYIEDLSEDGFSMISMRLRDMSEKARDDLTEYFFHFNEQFFKEPCTFRMKEDRIVMIYPLKKNPNAKEHYKSMMEEFEKLYDKFRIDYKLIFIDSNKNIQYAKEYIDLCEMLEAKISWDSYHWVTDEDVEKFIHIQSVIHQLKDINDKMDLHDDRVQVYCQPVLNTETGKFTTAEALMRIILPDIGFIFPDEFIPIAERHGYIHSLSKIILSKTCENIIKLEERGYDIERVSVNFSMIELRDANFCDDLVSIINNTGLDPSKIAIELTESKNEKDFENVKNVMNTLQHLGIKFYLDDFGTGYSNFARIIGLPIDIIKFDRSLTIMSGKDEDSKYMVGSFSDIFENSKYQVLFEGVEDEADEMRCIDMKAQYLQGYKYSKPIPIDQLDRFLEKRA